MTSLSDILKQKRQKTADKKVSGKNPYKIKNGVTTMRILPSWRQDDPTFFHEFGQSFIKSFDDKVVAVVADRKLTYGEDEPLRDAINRAIGDAVTDGQRKHYKEMLAKPRVLVNALILSDKEVDPKIAELVDFSETQFDQILEQIELAGITPEEFLSLTEGFNLKVSKSGIKFDTKYTFAIDRKASSVDESAMATVTDLDAYVRAKFEDHDKAMNALKAITQGLALEPEHKALSYSGDSPVVDGEFTDATTNPDADAPVENVTVSNAEIDELFSNDGDDVPF